jgi:hypothetical protein
MVTYRPRKVPWCSGQTCGPVKAEIAGSNPVGTAINQIPIQGWGFFISQLFPYCIKIKNILQSNY